ncbi:MAG: hypothetical protein N2595_08435, partial [bacterium]|nr:hypothetical protein [bacterium]
MKVFWRLVLSVMVVGAAVAVAEEQKEESNLGNVGRGFVSVVTCPLELIRWMAYDGAQYTVPGLSLIH